MISRLTLLAALLCAASCGGGLPEIEQRRAESPPELFPGRIWAACDFERLRGDVVWGGRLVEDDVPAYPANRFAVQARAVDNGKSALNVIFTRYPRADSSSSVYFRYRVDGASNVELRLYNHTRRCWHRALVTALMAGEWAEAAVDFGGAPGGDGNGPIASGDRVGEVMFVVDGGGLLVDDVICYSGPPAGGESEKFPQRVIMTWGFDPVEYYHPWTHTDYRIVHDHPALTRDWGAAEALGRERIHDNQQSGAADDYDRVKRIRLIIDPPQQVGDSTRLRFRCRTENADRVQPMIFDLTDMDNRHVVIDRPPNGRWHTRTVYFTRNGIRNDGAADPFEAGSVVDDVFFLAWPDDPAAEFELLVDDIVLYDARP